MTERLTSRKNPLALHVRKLGTSRAHRREAGQYLCEGPKLLHEALRWGAAVETVIAADGAELPALPASIRQVSVPPDLLESLCETKSPQGVLFLCRLPETALPERPQGGRYLVLDGVQDPGNVGTIWRTADAFGADGLLLVGPCADPFGPKTVRATMGACFRLPVWECEWEQAARAMEAVELPLYAAALTSDAADLRQVDLRRAAVVIGSEGSGVSPAVTARCAGALRIPMRERCESLNAAVAAAVVLWEMRVHGE